MWSLALSARWAKVALVILASSAITATLASPFNADSQLESRATGKSVGSACTSSSECISKNCVYYNGAKSQTCRRQPPGGPCTSNSNCGSRICAKGVCSQASTNGTCDTVSDCSSSNLCSSGRCSARTLTVGPNSPCSTNSDCSSGSCQALKSCFDANGNEVRCSADQLHCTRLPNGSACANDGDCGFGFCRSGTCTASVDGDACVHESQCTGVSICGTQGVCHTPGTKTLYSQEICGAASQCFSNRCLSNLKYTDPYDQVFDYFGPFEQPTRCDYLRVGGTKCRSYTDCVTGICKADKCVLGTSGVDRCLFNQHCSSGLCGSSSTADGICQKLPPNGGTDVGRPCSASGQCATQRCETGFIKRPVPFDPSQSYYVQDLICVQSEEGGSCLTDSECSQGVCRGAVCTFLSIGQTCASDPQCGTYNCAPNASGSALVCDTAEFQYPCSANSDCYSQVCDFNNGSLCTAVSPTGTCRTDNDCDYNKAVCDSSRTCRNIRDKPCTANAECLSGTCASTGLCA
ncbi:hypothetical protein V8E36_008581 [Tilletia maclaganii]